MVSALVTITDGSGSSQAQSNGSIQELAPGDQVVFSLTSATGIVQGQRWVLAFDSVESRSLDELTFVWAPPVAVQTFSVPLPPAGFAARYFTAIYDQQGNALSFATGIIFGATGAVTKTSGFTQPSIGATVTAPVISSSWMAPGEFVFNATGGYYQVSSIPDPYHVVLLNPATYSDLNAGPGTTIPNGSVIVPSGVRGATGATGATGAAGAGPVGSVGLSGTTGTLTSAGDTVTYNVACATSNKTYRFRATCVIRCPSSTGGGGSPQTGHSWTRSIWVLAENTSGTVRIVSSWYDGDPEGDPVMATGGIGGGCAITVGGVSGTNVQLIATGNGNNGATNLSVTWSGADQWGGT